MYRKQRPSAQFKFCLTNIVLFIPMQGQVLQCRCQTIPVQYIILQM